MGVPPSVLFRESLRQAPSPRMQDARRSRSAPSACPSPGLGLTRTPRTPRNNSLSSVSPLPLTSPRIVIPHGNGHMNGHGHVSMHSFGGGVEPVDSSTGRIKERKGILRSAIQTAPSSTPRRIPSLRTFRGIDRLGGPVTATKDGFRPRIRLASPRTAPAHVSARVFSPNGWRGR